MKYYVMYCDREGVHVIVFDSEGDRQEWLLRSDDTFYDFYCLDVEGELKAAFTRFEEGWRAP